MILVKLYGLVEMSAPRQDLTESILYCGISLRSLPLVQANLLKAKAEQSASGTPAQSLNLECFQLDLKRRCHQGDQVRAGKFGQQNL